MCCGIYKTERVVNRNAGGREGSEQKRGQAESGKPAAITRKAEGGAKY